jgi:LysM repeat protein
VKKAWAFGVVAAVHVVVLGSLLLQGCGTTRPQPVTQAESPVVMPPVTEAPVLPPVVEPVKVALPPVEFSKKTYTVKAGDSLSRIAQRFNVSTRDIIKMNKISNPNKIVVGTKLTLPGYVDLNAKEPVRKVHKATAPKVAKKATAPKAVKKSESSAVAGEAPAVATAETPAPAADAAVLEAKPGELLHVVEPNQQLEAIAMMYGVRVEELVRLNNLTSPDVKVGQTLKIPPPVE